jgi:hypothetical protein
MDPSFKSEALSSQGVEIRVGNIPVDGTPPDVVTQAITSLTNTNPATLKTADMAALESGMVVLIDGTSAVAADGKVFVLGDLTGTAPNEAFEVTGLDLSAELAAITTGTVGTVPWLNLCETKTFSGFDGQSSEMDVTTLCSVAKEYRVGLQDFGAFNFTMNYVPSDPGTQLLQQAKAAGKPVWINLQLPEDEGEFLFQAYVRQMTIAGGVDQPITTNVVLRITGAPVFIAGAAADSAANDAGAFARTPRMPERQRVAA